MSTKELQEKILKTMKTWQTVEDASVESTGKVMKKTKNPIVKMVMEIIQRDSQMHHRVQELISDSLQKTISLSPDELAEVSEMLEKHLQLEKRMVSHVEEALASLKGKKMLVQEYLLNYLLEDEKKHDRLLENLGKIKGGIYPYA